MKTNYFCPTAIGLLVLSILFNLSFQRIVRQKPEIRLKVYHPTPERNLRQIKVSKELGSQNYNLDDDFLEITKKQFMDDIKFKKNMNLTKPLGNYFSKGRVLTEDPPPPIKEDFLSKLDEALVALGDDFKKEDKEDGVYKILKKDQPVADVKLTVKDKDPNNDEYHNVIITIENYDYTGEFDKKRMEGLAIIEDANNHRGEIDSFLFQKIEELANTETDNEEKESQGLKSIGEGLTEILKEVDDKIENVGGDENSGYVFEKRSEKGVILALVMAYTVGDELYEIKLKTRAMDEFEMQVREFLREEDKNTLSTQLKEILKSGGITDNFSIEDVATTMNDLVKGVMSNKDLTESCAEDIAYKTEFLEEVPNTIVLNALSAGGGGDFGEFGAFGGEETTDEPKPAKVCIFGSSHVTMLEGLEMPYLFFAFRNDKMMIEHFIPAIEKASAVNSLKEAFQGIVQLNQAILTAMNNNLDEQGNPIKDPVEFKIETLKSEIDKKVKSLKLTFSKEDDKMFWKEGKIVRILITEVGGSYKVNFNFPHKLYKNKDATKPITNEFIFEKSIAYDAVGVFSDTLDKFVDAMKAARKK